MNNQAGKGYILVYITVANLEEAKAIAKHLIEKRLTACCNIIPQIESIYWWQGKIVQEKEALILAKTSKAKEKEVITFVKKVHSYEVPDITTFEISTGFKPYLDWISKEVKK